ncbi:hypothetical protein Tco_1343560 [Tanacetum coccineum]
MSGAASEWFTKEFIGSITTWDNMVEKFILKFYHLSDYDEEETEEDDNLNKMENVPEIFKIEGNLFDFETPLWYDELADGKLKDETIALKAKIEGSCTGKTARILVEDECSRDCPIYSYGKFQTGTICDYEKTEAHVILILMSTVYWKKYEA